MTVLEGIPNELSDCHQKDPSYSLRCLPQQPVFSIATLVTTSAEWSYLFFLQLVSLYNRCYPILLITPSNRVARAGQGGKGAPSLGKEVPEHRAGWAQSQPGISGAEKKTFLWAQRTPVQLLKDCKQVWEKGSTSLT